MFLGRYDWIVKRKHPPYSKAPEQIHPIGVISATSIKVEITSAASEALYKIEAGKKFSKQKRFATPSEELTQRAKKYARQYDIDYETAVVEIMDEDLVLSKAYNLYDVDTLLGLKD